MISIACVVVIIARITFLKVIISTVLVLRGHLTPVPGQ